MKSFGGKSSETFKNVIENESHFVAKIIDDHLGLLEMLTKMSREQVVVEDHLTTLIERMAKVVVEEVVEAVPSP
nr:hypothetical protein [Tanacetum cinerariifolium]GEY54197.1 hypothetical protein [Tanacetum cinerariifolium]